MVTIIKNGTIVLPKENIRADVMVKNEKIVKIGVNIQENADRVVDATGKFLIAGCIDSHTHFDLDTGSTKTADDFYSGTRAAAVGGTTTIIDFATQDKGKTLKDAVEAWDHKSFGKSYCDFSYHMAITDWNENVRKEMTCLAGNGITSFKLYMAYKGSLQVDDFVIYNALEESKKIGALIGFHCENGDIIQARIKENLRNGNKSPYYHGITRPNIVEVEAINRLISLAEITNSEAWVVHLSTSEGLELIKKANKNGICITSETCPQYLMLDESVYGSPEDKSFEAAKYVLSPPIRSKKDQEALWRGLENKEIDFISTDHCSFNLKGQKELGLDDYSKIPNGGPGVEHRFLLMYTYGVATGKISINDMTKLLSYNPAQIFGLENKGSIEVGKDADLFIFDPEGETVISAENQTQNVDYTPYEGFKIRGKIEKVFVRGMEVASFGKITIDEPIGKFQKRGKSSKHNL